MRSRRPSAQRIPYRRRTSIPPMNCPSRPGGHPWFAREVESRVARSDHVEQFGEHHGFMQRRPVGARAPARQIDDVALGTAALTARRGAGSQRQGSPRQSARAVRRGDEDARKCERCMTGLPGWFSAQARPARPPRRCDRRSEETDVAAAGRRWHQPDRVLAPGRMQAVLRLHVRRAAPGEAQAAHRPPVHVTAAALLTG